MLPLHFRIHSHEESRMTPDFGDFRFLAFFSIGIIDTSIIRDNLVPPLHSPTDGPNWQ